MEYEDTRTIATPEGVELELRLAGIGSRFSAALIDFAIQGALLIAVILLAALTLGSLGATIATSVGVLFAFVVYDVLFEVRAAGRTPGKRALGIRVVLADGGPVTLRASTVRNLIRLVEGVATFYVPALLSILLTRDNQRLGDLAGGTVVTHEAAPPAGRAHTGSRGAARAAAGVGRVGGDRAGAGRGAQLPRAPPRVRARPRARRWRAGSPTACAAGLRRPVRPGSGAFPRGSRRREVIQALSALAGAPPRVWNPQP